MFRLGLPIQEPHKTGCRASEAVNAYRHTLPRQDSVVPVVESDYLTLSLLPSGLFTRFVAGCGSLVRHPGRDLRMEGRWQGDPI